MTEKIEVIYICDEKFVKLTAISIYSLLYNNKSNNIKIWLIANGIKKESKGSIIELVHKFHKEIAVVDAIDLKERFIIPKTIYSNLSVYNNLFLASMINAEKAIYIDGDTIILRSLSEMWEVDIKDKYVAGVKDTIGIIERAEAGIGRDELYINTGVMLCNLNLWREDQLEKKYIDYINGHTGKYIFRSQRIINAVCKNKMIQISPHFNLLPDYIRFNHKQNCILHQTKTFYDDKVLFDARSNPCILHYAGREYNRPWYNKCIHPMKGVFEEYESQSGWHMERKEYRLRKKIQFEKILIQYMPNTVYIIIANINNTIKCIKKGVL
ncbi:MAG: glycosyltransferase family 8 protein [Lachnospiraceae bacterium]|nr:glycosyltransferase family 8 protein [Lachnospiraceae bacterium]